MKTNKYYVTMSDKFLSGRGMAENKINKMIVECETYDQALIIERNAKKRDEMKYINICFRKPSYNKERYLESWKNWNDLGVIWKE